MTPINIHAYDYANLDAIVQGQNEVNRHTNVWCRIIREAIRPLVGQLVRTAKDGRAKKLSAMLPNLPCTSTLHVWLETSYCAVWVRVRTSDVVEDVLFQSEQGSIVGCINNGTLESVPDDVTPHRTHYDSDTLRQQATEAEGLSRQLASLKEVMSPFDWGSVNATPPRPPSPPTLPVLDQPVLNLGLTKKIP